jgi:hypothetical protein
MEMAHAYGPPMLAQDGLILDIPLEEQQSRTSDLLAQPKTIFPIAHQSIRDARAQLHTGYPDIPTYLSNVTEAAPTMTVTPTFMTAPITNILLPRALPPHRLVIRQRLQNAITQLTKTAVIGTRIWCRMWVLVRTVLETVLETPRVQGPSTCTTTRTRSQRDPLDWDPSDAL